MLQKCNINLSKQLLMQFQQKWRLLGLLQPTGTLRVMWCLVTLGDQRGRSYLHSWLFCTHPISCTTVSMPMGDSKRSKSTLEPITFLITTKIQPQLYGRPPPWIIKNQSPFVMSFRIWPVIFIIECHTPQIQSVHLFTKALVMTL